MILAVLVAEPAAAPVLRWQAPPPCPSAAEVHELVRFYENGQPQRPNVWAEATVVATADGWSLAAAIVAPEGRTHVVLRDRDCRVLASATALLMAVHLDGARSQEREVEAAPPRRRAPRLHGLVRGFGGVATGLTPRPAGAVGLAFGLAGRAVRAELALAYAFERAAEVGVPGVGVGLRMGSATLRGCWAPRSGRAQFPLCGDLELGVMLGRGRGVDAARTRAHLWLAAGVGAGVIGWVQPNVGLWLEGRAHVALTRPQFIIDGIDTVFRAPSAGVRVLAGIEVRFALAGRRNSFTARRRGGD
ncbi:hypothetical protein [Nannocystis sp. SCPEA4]|uniref:hypothetical protein n=1 Tax=Nannocystis sp. SCPEA4 TaxID=2996787 RepID=UPI00226DD945|nr:hypothetical protein [Nannocystis sp. SCPEA4]MCY1056558.1 hypothetical protein [Nannocystis sp. SCPEA4]